MSARRRAIHPACSSPPSSTSAASKAVDMPKDVSKTSGGTFYSVSNQGDLKRLANTLLIGTAGEDARTIVRRSRLLYASRELKLS